MVKPLAAAWMLGLGSLPAAWKDFRCRKSFHAGSQRASSCLHGSWMERLPLPTIQLLNIKLEEDHAATVSSRINFYY